MFSRVGFRAACGHGYRKRNSHASKSPAHSSARENPLMSVATPNILLPEDNTSSNKCIVNVTAAKGGGVLRWGNDILASADDVGGTVHVKYHESSIENDPVVIVWGMDSKGKEYEEIIHLKVVDITDATPAQMIALNAHLSKSDYMNATVGEPGTLWTSRELRNDANQKMNFERHYRDFIAMELLGNNPNVALYCYRLKRYILWGRQNKG